MACSLAVDRLERAERPGGYAYEDAGGFEEWPSQFEGRSVRICIRDLLAERGSHRNRVSYQLGVNDWITREKRNVTEKLDETKNISTLEKGRRQELCKAQDSNLLGGEA